MPTRLAAFLLAFAISDCALLPAVAAPNLQQTFSALQRELDSGRVPGASVIVIENGQVVVHRNFGYADVARRLAVKDETLFRAGSIAKSFVGLAVMLLVDQRKLNLDTPLSVLDPDIRFRNPWEATNPVRLANLLEHTSGWADMSPREFAADTRGWALLQAIDYGGTRVSRWPPGTYMSYSNVGPSVAAHVVERISGQSFDAFVRQRLFTPLEMRAASFALLPAAGIDLSRSYLPDGTTPAPYELSGLRPSGDLMISAKELVNLPLLMLGRGVLHGRRILSESAVLRIERSETSLSSRLGLRDNYGLGNDAIVGHKAVFRGHGGAIDGFDTLYAYWPGHGAGYVVFTNGGDGVTNAMRDTLESYLARDETEPDFKASPRSRDALSRLAATYQPIAPRSDFRRLIDDLTGFVSVTSIDGHLYIDGVERVPSGRYALRRRDLAAPTYVLAESGSGDELLSASDAYRRVEPWTIAAKIAFAAALCLVGLGILGYAPVWLIAAARGKLGLGAAAVRLLPFLAVVSFLALSAEFAAALQIPDAEQPALFGRPSTISIALFATTLAIPLFGAAGVAACLLPRKNDRLVRTLGFSASSLVLLASAYLALFGWIGMRTWLL